MSSIGLAAFIYLFDLFVLKHTVILYQRGSRTSQSVEKEQHQHPKSMLILKLQTLSRPLTICYNNHGHLSALRCKRAPFLPFQSAYFLRQQDRSSGAFRARAAQELGSKRLSPRSFFNLPPPCHGATRQRLSSHRPSWD